MDITDLRNGRVNYKNENRTFRRNIKSIIKIFRLNGKKKKERKYRFELFLVLKRMIS